MFLISNMGNEKSTTQIHFARNRAWIFRVWADHLF